MKVKKILAVVLALVMVIALGVPAFAATPGANISAIYLQDENGNIIKFDIDDLANPNNEKLLELFVKLWERARTTSGTEIYVETGLGAEAKIIAMDQSFDAKPLGEQVNDPEEGQEKDKSAVDEALTIAPQPDSNGEFGLVDKDGKPAGSVTEEGEVDIPDPGPGDEDTFTVSGKVTDGTGPVAGATVTLSVAGEIADLHQTTTGATGAYLFEDVAEGAYTLTVTADGYEDYTGTVTVDGAAVVENVELVAEGEPAQTLEEAQKAAQDAIDDLVVTNATTAKMILDAVKAVITNEYISADWSVNPAIKAATDLVDGSIKGKITLQIGTGAELETAVVDVDRVIVATQTLEKAKDAITALLPTLAKNETTKAKMQLEIDKALSPNITATIEDYVKDDATNTEVGSITGTIILSDGENEDVEVEIDLEIAIVPFNTTAIEEALDELMLFYNVPSFAVDGSNYVEAQGHVAAVETALAALKALGYTDEEFEALDGYQEYTDLAAEVDAYDPDARDTGSVTGTVKAKQGLGAGTPVRALEGALVTITSSVTDGYTETVGTNAQGVYTFTAVPYSEEDETYTITISASFYKEETITGIVVSTPATPAGEKTLLSSSKLLTSDNSTIAVIDVANYLVQIDDEKKSDDVAKILKTQHGATFKIFKQTDTNRTSDYSFVAMTLVNNDIVEVTAEDGTKKDYKIVAMSTEDLADQAVFGVSFTTPTAAEKPKLTGTLATMYVMVGASKIMTQQEAEGQKCDDPTTDVTLLPTQGHGDTITISPVAFNSTTFDPNKCATLQIDRDDIAPAAAPATTSDLSDADAQNAVQGANPSTATFKLNGTPPPAYGILEYQVGANGAWNLVPADYTLTDLLMPLVLADGTEPVVNVRYKETQKRPASAATTIASATIKTTPDDIDIDLEKPATGTGTVITGLAPKTAVPFTSIGTKFAYKLFEITQEDTRPARGTTIAAGIYSDIIPANGEFTVTKAGVEGKYLVVVELNAANNKLVGWKQIELTDENVTKDSNIDLTQLTIVATPLVTNSGDITRDNAGKSKLTTVAPGTNMRMWVSKAKTSAATFAQTEYTWRTDTNIATYSTEFVQIKQDDLHYFKDGPGNYILVKTTDEGYIVGASTFTVTAAMMTYIVNVLDMRDAGSELSVAAPTEIPAGSAALTGADAQTVTNILGTDIVTGVYFGVAGDDWTGSVTFLEADSAGTADNEITKTAVPDANNPYLNTITINRDDIWDFGFPSGTYEKVTGTAGPTEFSVSGSKMNIDGRDYNLPAAGTTLRSVVDGLKVGDSFTVQDGGALEAIAIAASDLNTGTRTIKIKNDECHSGLALTGGLTDASAAVSTTNILIVQSVGDLSNTAITVVNGAVNLEGVTDTTSPCEIAVTGTTPGAVITAGANQKFTVTQDGIVTINGLKVTATTTAPEVTVGATDVTELTLKAGAVGNVVEITLGAALRTLIVDANSALPTTGIKNSNPGSTIVVGLTGLTISADVATTIDASALVDQETLDITSTGVVTAPITIITGEEATAAASPGVEVEVNGTASQDELYKDVNGTYMFTLVSDDTADPSFKYKLNGAVSNGAVGFLKTIVITEIANGSKTLTLTVAADTTI